jgi:phosphoribosylformylglycinamidine synthase subunit PurQ / glutaminase
VIFGIVIFPGSNCDHDCFHVLEKVMGQKAVALWHKDTSLQDVDCIILPGGFAHGDYLRTGAIARFSPIMKSVEKFAKSGGPVIGICNGFQILLESGLLPGAMLINNTLQFRCQWVHIRVENTDTPFTNVCEINEVLKVPIAHGEGNYFIDEKGYKELIKHNQVIFRYCDTNGRITKSANPNGSLGNIAGICNRERNVVGLMPHPERASEHILGSSDGKIIFESIVNNLVLTGK